MTNLPHSVILKIYRAQEHLHAVKDAIRVHLKIHDDPPHAYKDLATNEGVLVFRAKRSPDPRISAIAGDCIANMRAALDHLICALVAHVGSTVTIKHQFPICCDLSEFERCEKQGQIACIPKAARDIIESAQPYKRGNLSADPLWILKELSNTDKHRTLHVAIAYVPSLQTTITVNGQPVSVTSSGPFYDGTEIARVSLPPNSRVDVEVSGSMLVAFKDAPVAGRDVIEVLQQSLDLLEHKIIPSLEPFFHQAI